MNRKCWEERNIEIDERDFKISQLEQIIEDLKRTHKLEIEECEDETKALKASLRLKAREQNVTYAEHTMKYFPSLVLKCLTLIDPTKRLSNLYLKTYSFVNYALVCGVGIFINMYVLLGLVNTMPLYLANLFAIFIAWIWNWNLSVGPLGYLMGLSRKRKTTTGGT